MASTGFCPPPAPRPAIPPTEEDTTFRHRRIQGEVQDENAWVLNGVAGHAGLFSNVPDLLRFAREILCSAKPASKTPPRQPDPSQAPPFRPGPSWSVSPSASPRRQFARARMGHAIRNFLFRQAFFARIPSGIWATAAAPYGSIWTPASRSFSSPTAPGPTAKANSSARSDPLFTMPSARPFRTILGLQETALPPNRILS